MKRLNSVALVLLVMVAACGASATSREIVYARAGLDTSWQLFIEHDRKVQRHIAETAPLDQARELLQAHRTRRNNIVEKFVIAYSGIALAVSEPKKYDWKEAVRTAKSVVQVVLDWKAANP